MTRTGCWWVILILPPRNNSCCIVDSSHVNIIQRQEAVAAAARISFPRWWWCRSRPILSGMGMERRGKRRRRRTCLTKGQGDPVDSSRMGGCGPRITLSWMWLDLWQGRIKFAWKSFGNFAGLNCESLLSATHGGLCWMKPISAFNGWRWKKSVVLVLFYPRVWLNSSRASGVDCRIYVGRMTRPEEDIHPINIVEHWMEDYFP